MKNADMPAMPVTNGDNEPAGFDHQFYRNGNLATGLTKLETVALHLMAALIGKADSRYEPKHAAEDAFRLADAFFAEQEARNDQ